MLQGRQCRCSAAPDSHRVGMSVDAQDVASGRQLVALVTAGVEAIERVFDHSVVLEFNVLSYLT